MIRFYKVVVGINTYGQYFMGQILKKLHPKTTLRISHWTTMRVECDRTHCDDESMMSVRSLRKRRGKCLLRNHIALQLIRRFFMHVQKKKKTWIIEDEQLPTIIIIIYKYIKIHRHTYHQLGKQPVQFGLFRHW